MGAGCFILGRAQYTAMIAASLILGIVLTSWQAVRALSAERQAFQAQAQAKADRDRTHKEKRRAENALADVQKEKQRAEDALAEATSERSKADDLGKTAILMHFLHGAMDGTDHDKNIGVNMALLPIVPLKAPIERLVQLYEAWEKPDEAAKWRKELEAFNR